MPVFLQQTQYQPQGNFTTTSHPTSTTTPFKRQKPLKSKPDLREPALEGYVAGWRQTDFDDDAQEFSFAMFEPKDHHCNTTSSGYEGDDEKDENSAERDERVRREEFETLERGTGLGRSGSYRER